MGQGVLKVNALTLFSDCAKTRAYESIESAHPIQVF